MRSFHYFKFSPCHNKIKDSPNSAFRKLTNKCQSMWICRMVQLPSRRCYGKAVISLGRVKCSPPFIPHPPLRGRPVVMTLQRFVSITLILFSSLGSYKILRIKIPLSVLFDDEGWRKKMERVRGKCHLRFFTKENHCPIRLLDYYKSEVIGRFSSCQPRVSTWRSYIPTLKGTIPTWFSFSNLV